MLSEELMFRRRALMGQKQDSILYEAYNLSFDGTNYIDTGVYLFTQENINKDFEFIAEGIYGPVGVNSHTIICTKDNANALGFLVRTTGDTGTKYAGTIFVKSNDSATVIVKRINGVMTLSGINITNPTVRLTNGVFDWSLHLGCAIDDNGNRYRYATGTINHVVVRWL